MAEDRPGQVLGSHGQVRVEPLEDLTARVERSLEAGAEKAIAYARAQVIPPYRTDDDPTVQERWLMAQIEMFYRDGYKAACDAIYRDWYREAYQALQAKE